MAKYFATFISGTQEIVSRQLKRLPIELLRVTYFEDGLVVFNSEFPPERIIDFRFFNNTFLLLKDFGTKEDQTLDGMVGSLLNFRLTKSQEINRLTVNKALKIAAVKENQPVSLANHKTLEGHLAEQLPVGHRGVVQFQLILRRDGTGLFGLRLPRPLFKRAKRPAGALRPELVHILGLVANLSSKDIVLDPFAGHGSVINEALQGFHVRRFIATEKDDQLVTKLKRNYTSDKVAIMKGSATELSLKDNSINKIITDPPWGIYAGMKQQQLLDLYKQSLKEMVRVLKPGGLLVLLSGNNDLNEMVAAAEALDLLKTYKILVSGKKSTILKLRKKM